MIRGVLPWGGRQRYKVCLALGFDMEVLHFQIVQVINKGLILLRIIFKPLNCVVICFSLLEFVFKHASCSSFACVCETHYGSSLFCQKPTQADSTFRALCRNCLINSALDPCSRTMIMLVALATSRMPSKKLMASMESTT